MFLTVQVTLYVTMFIHVLQTLLICLFFAFYAYGDDCYIKCSYNGRPKCLPYSKHCDGKEDCDNGEDELECHVFKCNDWEVKCNASEHTCVARANLCNHIKDCIDGEDEKGERCNTVCSEESGHFKCDGKCLDFNLLCNNVTECRDKTDEDHEHHRRCHQECGERTCYPGECHRSPKGPVCRCPIGYRLDDYCKDIDECNENKIVCDHKCHNTQGSFSCSCAEGYKLGTDNSSCTNDEFATIFYTAYYSVRAFETTDPKVHWIVATHTEPVFGVTYDARYNNVYWSDRTRIYRSKRKYDQNHELVFDKGFSQIRNLAMDSISRNLYIVDQSEGRIVACNVDDDVHRSCKIILANLDKPGSIVVHPKRGYLFYTTVSKNGYVGRALLNGQNNEIIADKGVNWPNGIALDEPVDQIYFVDAYRTSKYVHQIDLDGKNAKSYQLHETYFPKSLGLWNSKLFWTCWSKRTIISRDKRTGEHELQFGYIESLQSLYVHYHSIQKGIVSNCECSHLCFTLPDNKYECSCPSHMHFGRYKNTCVPNEDIDNILVYSGTSVYKLEFSDFHKPVVRESNIQLYRGDISSIIDVKSEKNCYLLNNRSEGKIVEKCRSSSTTRAEALKGNYKIAYDYLRKNIYFTTHTEVFVMKENTNFVKKILPNHETINRPYDVAVLPEQGLLFVSTTSKILKCSLSGKNCSNFVEEHINKPNSIMLDTTQSEPILYWIDANLGRIDSVHMNGTLYKNVAIDLDDPLSLLISSTKIYWTLKNSNIVYYKDKTRDVISEIIIPDRKGQMLLFNSQQNASLSNPCKTSRCEEFCFSLNATIECGCSDAMLMCSNEGQCVPKDSKCNKSAECRDGSDELNCNKCPDDEFFCDGECMDGSVRCDGKRDCIDDLDEKDCSKCGEDQFMCDSGKCIDFSQRCDYHFNCGYNDKSDEVRCLSCEGRYKCTDGYCIDNRLVCDNIKHCESDESEEACNKTCRLGSRSCNSTKSELECVKNEKWCDGTPDCSNGADENNGECSYLPELNQFFLCKNKNENLPNFRCDDGTEIPRHKYLDKESNCRYNEDEEDYCITSNCTHECIPLDANNIKCDCPPGYKMHQGTCINIIECDDPCTCDHKCTDTDGSFNCFCDPGFDKDEDDLSTCIPKTEDLLIKVTDDSYNFITDSFKVVQKKPVNKKIIAGEYDSVKDAMILLSGGEISVDNSGYIRKVHTNSKNINAISYDQSSSNIYYTVNHERFSNTSFIYVTNIINGHTTLIYTSKQYIKSIFVSSKLSSLFHCRNDLAETSLYKSNLDGSIEHFIDKGRQCGSLTVDEHRSKGVIYWTDTFLNQIISSDLYGKNKKVHTLKASHMPSSLHIIGSSLVFYIKESKRLQICPSKAGRHCYDKEEKDVRALITLKSNPDRNSCDNNKCEYLCIPLPNAHHCACPLGYEKNLDRKCVPMKLCDPICEEECKYNYYGQSCHCTESDIPCLTQISKDLIVKEYSSLMTIIIISIIVILLISIALIYMYKRKLFCFKPNKNQNLKFVNPIFRAEDPFISKSQEKFTLSYSRNIGTQNNASKDNLSLDSAVPPSISTSIDLSDAMHNIDFSSSSIKDGLLEN